MKPAHVPLVAGLGLCLFLNQLLFILGLHLAGMTLAACMQPAIPVFTALLSMLCGQEAASVKRVSGAEARPRPCEWGRTDSGKLLSTSRIATCILQELCVDFCSDIVQNLSLIHI